MDWNLQALADDARVRRLNALLPGIATGLLAIVAAWLASGLAWQGVLLLTSEPQLPPADRIESSNTANDDRVDVQRIADLHLFGRADATDAPAAETIDAPETRLNLQLQGILAGDGAQEDDRYGLAIIRSGSSEKVYAPGDTVSGGARVHAVLADRVILRRNGQLETLRLPKLGAEMEGIDVSTPSSSPMPPPPGDLSMISEEIRQDPSKLSEVIRYSPVLQEGSVKGYRVYPGRDRSAFSAAGLRPGDIVTAVNGASLDDPAQAMGLLNSLQDASALSLTIERGGETITVELNVSQ